MLSIFTNKPIIYPGKSNRSLTLSVPLVVFVINTIMKRLFLIILIGILFLTNCFIFERESHSDKILFNNSAVEFVNCSDPPWGTYHCKITVVNRFSCDYKVQMYIENNKYSSSVLLNSDNKTIYNGDWYGDKLKLEVQKLDTLCLPNEVLKIKYVYYH